MPVLYISVVTKTSKAPPPATSNLLSGWVTTSSKKTTSDGPVELCHVEDLEKSFQRWKRAAVSDFIRETILGFVKTLNAGDRTQYAVEDEGLDLDAKINIYMSLEGIAGAVVTDAKYSKLVANNLAKKIVDEFQLQHPRTESERATANSIQFSSLREYITTYQNPEQADPMSRITKELEDTRSVLEKTIKEVAIRGEHLDAMMAKSEGLSTQSRLFYTQARKQNSCCSVM